MRKVITFEEACEALKLNPVTVIPDFSVFPEKHQKAMAAHAKLIIIVEAVNDGWTPNWDDTNERKFELWPDIEKDETKPSGFGLSYDDCAYWTSNTDVGSRLCFKSREAAEHTFETFKQLYEDYLLIG